MRASCEMDRCRYLRCVDERGHGNLALIEEAIRSAGNTEVTTQLLPGLNHLVQTATTGAPGEYAQIAETMAPAAMQAGLGLIDARWAP